MYACFCSKHHCSACGLRANTPLNKQLSVKTCCLVMPSELYIPTGASKKKRRTNKWPFTGGLNLKARERHPLWDLDHVWSAKRIGLRFCYIWGREFWFGSQDVGTAWTAVPQTLVTPASDLTLSSLEAWWRIFFPPECFTLLIFAPFFLVAVKFNRVF